MRSDWPVGSPLMRYALQGRAPFEWIGRGRICYSPSNYTPTPTAGTSEIADQLNAHLAGIDAALTGGGGGGDAILLETGDSMLLETGADTLLIEA